MYTSLMIHLCLQSTSSFCSPVYSIQFSHSGIPTLSNVIKIIVSHSHVQFIFVRYKLGLGNYINYGMIVIVSEHPDVDM